MSRLLTLQLTRGVAANLVVLSHLSVIETKYTGGQILPTFSFYGTAGVDIFFVLSGFIMVKVAGKGIGPFQFLWRRVARIYPAYWLVSLVVLATSLIEPAWVNSSVQGPVSLWRSFLLVPDKTLPLLAVGWTLIHEMYFYLVFAALLVLRITLPVGLMGWGVALVVVTILGGESVMNSALGNVCANPLTLEFMAGTATGILYNHKNLPGEALAGVTGLLMLGVSIVFVAPDLALANNTHLDAWRVLLFGLPAALIVYWLAAFEQKASPTPPRLLVALGDWSYATYLTHVLVLSAIGRLIHGLAPPGAISSLVLIIVGFLAVNLVGAFMFRFFEQPTLAVLHRLGSH